MLLGAWVIDETDVNALAALGDVLLEFDGVDSLQYTIRGQDKDQIIKLRYWIEGSEIVTDQPSHPRKERTPFTLTEDGALILTFAGMECRFVRGRARASAADGVR